MKEIFTKVINTGGADREFEFERVFYDKLWYHVTFTNTEENNKREQFRLYQDEEGQWKIAAQILPLWIHDKGMEFNDFIEDNETVV